MKIVFMGTPDFAKESLSSLIENNYKVDLVVTNPDRPSGRGMKLKPSPVKEYALEQGIEVIQPEKIRNNNEIVEKLKDLKPDLLIVVAYGKIIPNEILDIPTMGAINVHGSLLPKYRGAAPIQWAVLNGDKTTGITTMFINEKMDEGDMLLKQEVEIGDNESVGEVWAKLSKVGAELLVKTVQGLETGNVERISQESIGEEPTYAPMLDKSMAKIKWEEQTSLEIKNLARGLDPIMGAYGIINDEKIKLWKVEIVDFEVENALAGEIVFIDKKQGLYIKTIDGVISVLEIQGQNAKRMNIKEYLLGSNLNIKGRFI